MIGPDGARKLNDLAARKGVCLEEYLAASDVSQFQPLAEVEPIQARQIWKTLQALPDAQAATSPVSNGKTSSSVSF